MKASDIQRLLDDRHAEDVYVSECKDGGTWNRDHCRLDGWAMEKSWSRPRMIGYEIKVSRGDFMQDTKWPAYLPLCNELYFVCPAKLIQPSEVPDKVGLIWAGARLLTKKKAAYREVTAPAELFKYVLMCRARIGPEVESGDSRAHKLRVWQSWLAEKREARRLGYEVKREIREMIDATKRENAELKRENERLTKVKEELKKLDMPEWTHSYHIQGTLDARKRVFDASTFQAVQRAIDGLTQLKATMRNVTPEDSYV